MCGGGTVCKEKRWGEGVPHRSAGVHEDRLLIERRCTAYSAAVFNPGKEDSDTFIILIRMK